MQCARLPNELWDRSIDHLWANPRALRACSLTCRDWVPSSRYHLFGAIDLRSEDDLRLFQRLLKISVATGVVRYIRELCISTDYLADFLLNSLTRPSSSSTLLSRLVAVECLALEGDWSKYLPISRFLALLDCFIRSPLRSNVRTLRLASFHLTDGDHVLRLLFAFPNLRSLDLSTPSQADTGPTITTVSYKRITLYELAVDGNNRYNIVLAQWLQLSFGGLHLRKLHWYGHLDNENVFAQKVLGSFLQSSSRTLRHIQLALDLSKEETALNGASATACLMISV